MYLQVKNKSVPTFSDKHHRPVSCPAGAGKCQLTTYRQKKSHLINSFNRALQNETCIKIPAALHLLYHYQSLSTDGAREAWSFAMRNSSWIDVHRLLPWAVKSLCVVQSHIFYTWGLDPHCAVHQNK